MKKKKSIFIFAIVFIFSTLIVCQIWSSIFPNLNQFQRRVVLVGMNSIYNIKSNFQDNAIANAQDNMNARAVIIFDDGYKSVYDIAYPIMQKYNVKANIAVIGDRIGQDGYMDEFELGVLYRDGYNMLNHSYTHVQDYALDKKHLEKEYKSCRFKLETRGFIKGSDIIIAPGGAYVENHLELLSNNRFQSVRSLDAVYIPSSNEPLDILVINVYGSRSIDEVLELMTVAKNKGQDIIVMFHKISLDEPISDMYVSKLDFCRIIEFLFFENIETITYEEVLKRYIF